MKMHTIPPLFTSADQWPNAPRRLIVFGPPGTGKTRAMLEDFVLPALDRGVGAHEILTCSFTRAAAEELRKRLSDSRGISERPLRRSCSTIHSECYHLIQQCYPKLNVVGENPADPMEADDNAATENTDVAKTFGENWNRNALRAWDYARAHCDRNRFLHYATELFGSRTQGFEHIVDQYEAAKKKANQIDFTDMLEFALTDPLCEPPERQLLIVDEVQDCSELQWRIVERWAAKSQYVVLVGDPDQSIHGWCGAKYERFEQTIETGYDVRRLGQSHRVPFIAHRRATKLIAQNSGRILVPYEAAHREGNYDILEEYQVAERLTKAVESKKSIFILAYRKKDCEKWARHCMRHHLPFRSERGGPRPLGNKQNAACVRAILAIRRGEEPNLKDLERLVKKMPARGSSPFFVDTTKSEVLRNATGSVLGFEVDGANFDPIRRGTLEEIALALHFDESAKGALVLAQRWGEAILEETPPITITTMHGSKGREADAVYLDMTLPGTVRNTPPEKLDACRRVLYVAITRTKDELIYIGSELERFLRQAKPSAAQTVAAT